MKKLDEIKVLHSAVKVIREKKKSIKVKAPVKEKKQQPQFYDDSWMYILLLTTLVILIESLRTYHFQVLDSVVTYGVFLLPFIYFIVNYLTKKYGYEKGIVAISVSGVSLVLFVLFMDWLLGNPITFSGVCGEFCAYVVSQLVNLTIYKFLLENTKSPFILVFLNYMFALIVFYMFYTLIYLNMIILDHFWLGYFVTLLIQSVICLFITFLDVLIAKGREKLR